MIKSILIVEDNEILSGMYKMKLELQWYDVDIAEDGKIWFEKIIKNKPNLVLLDLMMPNMNGFETLKELQLLWYNDSKIIVLSNLNDPKDYQKAMKLWANEFILKASLSPKELVEKIKEY